MNSNIPVFLETESTKNILDEVGSLIPKGTKVYLFGGAVRNAVYFRYFGEEMTQRDFDIIVIGDGETFSKRLIERGFIFGNKNSEKEKVIKKARMENPIHRYDDWVYLDCKIFPNTESVESVLQKITDFTVSGVALDLEDMYKDDWFQKVIAVPNALDDIKNKKVRLMTPYGIGFYKIIRLMSRGFEKPSNADALSCLVKLKNITEERFKTEIEKTVLYVGDRNRVMTLARSLGVDVDVLDFNVTTNYLSKIE